MSVRISSDDEYRFTEGDCWYLARAIHLITGWPLCAFEFRSFLQTEPEPDFHGFCEIPDGRYLDVYGAQTRDELYDRWGRWVERASIITFEWSDLRQMRHPFGPEFGHYTYARARRIAPVLVARALSA